MLTYDFDAELHSWHMVMDPLSPTLVDFVQNDGKDRFPDGRFIRAPALLTPLGRSTLARSSEH